MATNGISLDNLNIKITVNATAAKEALDNLARGVSETASSIPHAFDAFKTFAQELRDVATAARETNAALRGVADTLNKIRTQTGATFKGVAQTAQAMNQLGQACETVQVAGEDVGQELTTTLQESAKRGEKLKSVLSKIGTICEKVAFTSAKLLGQGLLLPIKRIGRMMENIGGSLSNLFSSVKRIAFYRLIRTAIKMVTQSLKEGVENLVAWDRVFENTSHAAETMDNLKSTAKLLTNTLGAMAMPIIQLVVPALNAIADAAITAANAINQFFRSLQGYGTYIKAIRGEVSGLSGAAKELKRVLFGFDELNVLPSQNGSGAGDSYENMFEEVDIEDTFFGKIRKLIKSKEWNKVGTELANKVNSIVGNIKADELGAKLGGKIQAAVDILSGFIGTLDFRGIGGKIATFLNNVLNSVNWTQVGELLIQKIRGLFELGLGFFEKLDWKQVGAALGGFLSGVINGLADWINDSDWYKFGQDFEKALCDLIEGLDPISIIAAVWNLIKAVLRAVWRLVAGLVAEKVDSLLDALPDWVFRILGVSKQETKLIISAAFEMSANDKAWINKLTNILNNKNDIMNVLAGSRSAYDYMPEYKKFQLGAFGLASGGFVPNSVNTGSLFWAGESGAELVTHAPGGTEVMNGNQVEQAMVNANIEVVNAIYAMANMVVNAVNNKDTNVYLDAQKVGQSVSQYQLNYARAYGG